MDDPTLYSDGQLSLARQRMAQAHAVVTRVQDETPPGPATDTLLAARAEAWATERVFASRVVELVAQHAGKAEDWRPGDWVLDAKGQVWVRAHPEGAAKGWPWDYPTEAGARSDHPDGMERVLMPEGGVEEERPVRPLVLLIRDGYPAR